MNEDIVRRVTSHPDYAKLKSTRTRFGWLLAVLGMIAYYGFILLVAFDKPFLAKKLGAGMTTIGMPLGVAVIVFTIIITWIYVRRANSEFDAWTDNITRSVLK